MPKKKKTNRPEKYEPLVITDLSFDEILKIAAHTPPAKPKPKAIPKKKKTKS